MASYVVKFEGFKKPRFIKYLMQIINDAKLV
jgi:hypothetical protein